MDDNVVKWPVRVDVTDHLSYGQEEFTFIITMLLAVFKICNYRNCKRTNLHVQAEFSTEYAKLMNFKSGVDCNTHELISNSLTKSANLCVQRI